MEPLSDRHGRRQDPKVGIFKATQMDKRTCSWAVRAMSWLSWMHLGGLG
jgi:hypothetical protein